MVWYCQRVLTDGVQHALLPMALGGIAFGLGCAAKWTGIYAGAGLAVLYLGVLWARRQQGRPGFWAEFRLAALGGVLFYVVLPLCIYVASYLPYWWRQPDFSLGDWWRCQLSMYSYHATLKATHPFESRWYTWLLGLRPVWYYRNGNLPYGMKASIAGMAGPVIWVVGLAALVGLFWHQVSGRGSRQGAAVLILYGTQLIPWMLVTRCTFLYHYFPSSMFCLAALALVLARMRHRDWARRLCAGLCAAAAVLFAVYYPALSGLPIPAWWADALEVLPSFGFYERKSLPCHREVPSEARRRDSSGLRQEEPKGGAQPMNGKHNKKLTPVAKKLRKNMTKEERRLWYDFLRGYPVRFLRQKVIGDYVVDFYCASAKLVVELDGSQHYEADGAAKDKVRTEFLQTFDLRVLRFGNHDVLQNFEGVCTAIDKAVQEALLP